MSYENGLNLMTKMMNDGHFRALLYVVTEYVFIRLIHQGVEHKFDQFLPKEIYEILDLIISFSNDVKMNLIWGKLISHKMQVQNSLQIAVCSYLGQ